MSKIILTPEAAAEIFRLRGRTYRKKVFVQAAPVFSDFTVQTHEGPLEAKEGDYLVRNTSGDAKPWPVKKAIFEQSYEEVETS